MERHGINVIQQPTSISTPTVATSGIPFVIGRAPIHTPESPAKAGVPLLCNDWDEAVSKLGYSDDWKKYTLCEFMYSHFQLYEMGPVIFCNVMDETMKSAVAAEDKTVADHKIELPFEAIIDDGLVITAAGGSGTAYKKDEDYAVYYGEKNLIIELLPDGAVYNAASLNVAYSAVNPEAVTSTAIATNIGAVDKCLTMTGVVPDLICAPGFSQEAALAAAMAAKAEKICGLYTGKALIDMDSSAEGATDYTQVLALKNKMSLIDVNQIACWPMLKLGDKTFHMSTQLAGLMAQVDASNTGKPYESPSNKNFQCDSVVLADGTEVSMSLSEANVLNFCGVVTAFGAINGLVCWGNYNACYPSNTDPKDIFIARSRMMAWVGNTEINTFWKRIDKPLTRILIDSIMDTINIWLNGLTSSRYLYGGTASFEEADNPAENLSAGILRIRNKLAPPGPAQQIDFVLEYESAYVTAALLD